jgi:hypothetical protein
VPSDPLAEEPEELIERRELGLPINKQRLD